MQTEQNPVEQFTSKSGAQTPSGIINLKAENVKRLSAVDITPQGNLIGIGGRNGQGKTSVLDAIVMALGGKKTHPEKPIHEGENHAKVEIELENHVILRTWTEKGTYLTVKSKDGGKYGQDFLDKLVGEIGFDPQAFIKMDTKQQAAKLRELVGIETEDLDDERKTAYDDRRIENAAVKECESQLKGLTLHEGVGDEEQSATQILDQISKVNQANLKRESAESDLQLLNETLADIDQRMVALEKQRALTIKHIESASNELESMPEILDVEPLNQQLKHLEETNKMVRENVQHARITGQRDKHAEAAETLDKRIKEIDEEKAGMLRDAKYPIEGLGFDENGTVTYGGIPLSQASAAEQIRVSVAIGLAMNPQLRIVLIRDASLLDSDSLAMLSDMATEHNAQIWIERVGEGEECQVIIEDGTVKGGAS